MADVAYTFDNLGRTTSVATSGQTLTYGWDALGRQTSAGAPLGAVTYQYDLAGRRTRMTWPDSFYVDYDYDATGAMTAVREYGATSGVGLLATFAYDDLGRRTSLTRPGGVVSTYTFDSASRLTSLAFDLSGTTYDQTYSFTYNAAFQAVTRTASNAAYAWPTPANGTTAYTANGLNQLSTAGSLSLSYDGRGNLTSGGSNTYSYDAANRLTGMSGVTLSYDPIGRLYETSDGVSTRFAYDGVDLIGEYNASGTLLRRYVHGPGLDEPLVWYEGSGTGDRRWLIPDQQGSIMALSNGTGAGLGGNAYDEYGAPHTGNVGRFSYTGQTWIPEVGLLHYKARLYSPALGRFLQPDPIGYGDGMNMYAYVQNDPVNSIDTLGLGSLKPGQYVSPSECRAGGGRVVTKGDKSYCVIDTGSLIQVVSGQNPVEVVVAPLAGGGREDDGSCKPPNVDRGRAGCLSPEQAQAQKTQACEAADTFAKVGGSLGLLFSAPFTIQELTKRSTAPGGGGDSPGAGGGPPTKIGRGAMKFSSAATLLSLAPALQGTVLWVGLGCWSK